VPERFPWLAETVVKDSILSVMPLTKTRHRFYAPLLPRLYGHMDLSDYDLVLTDSHSFAHLARKRSDAVQVCYYHSLWRPSTLAEKLLAPEIRRLDRRAAKRPDVVIAGSERVAKQIWRTYKREPEEVIYPPVDAASWSAVARKGDREGYVVLGPLIEAKKIDLTIEAAKLSRTRLHVVGTGPLREDLEAQARSAEVEFHGSLTQDELQALMAECRGVLLPGSDEFDPWPVRALAAGLAPVVPSESVAAEVVASEWGVTFSKATAASIADAMVEVERREFDPVALRGRAVEFDSTRFREKYSAAVLRAWARH
jgi:glycosyltransferase involved in cell wall biosynthesis